MLREIYGIEVRIDLRSHGDPHVIVYGVRWRIAAQLRTNRSRYAAGTASLVSTIAASERIQSSKQRRRSGFSR